MGANDSEPSTSQESFYSQEHRKIRTRNVETIQIQNDSPIEYLGSHHREEQGLIMD